MRKMGKGIGRWQMANGKWQMADGKWKIENGNRFDKVCDKVHDKGFRLVTSAATDFRCGKVFHKCDERQFAATWYYQPTIAPILP